ncbi:hypothetical protein FACS1894120_0460 [Clostridia bacterium]|nr:hypothetical protein FACS1894120_0460 [Clostridia bacterium]
MNIAEMKAFSKTCYNFLLNALEIEKLTHPEHYESAARVGERLRHDIKDLGQLEDLEPIPTLDSRADNKNKDTNQTT